MFYAHGLVPICRSAVAIVNYLTMYLLSINVVNTKDIFTPTAFAAFAHRVAL